MNNRIFKTSPLLLVSLILVGCISKTPPPDPLAQDLAHQAAIINQQLPITEQGIMLVRAQASGRQLTLKLFQNEDNPHVDLTLKQYGKMLCLQSEVEKRITEGAIYRIEWTNKSGAAQFMTMKHC